jgi:hypothetical protein
MKSFHVKVIPYIILFFFMHCCYSGFSLTSNAFLSVDPDPGPEMPKIPYTQKRTRRKSCFKFLDNLSEGWRIILLLVYPFLSLGKLFCTFGSGNL